jgi:tRNA(fMet)-specific endonuclease VapC
MKYLLDTNVISELVTTKPNLRVVNWIDSLDPDDVYLSVVTIGEIRKGIEKLPESKRKARLFTWLMDDLLLRFDGHILSLDVAVALAWGELTGRLARRGMLLSAVDSLIAAIALTHHCSLATRNESDFKATGIVVVNPWK